jgi:hypothetical protein
MTRIQLRSAPAQNTGPRAATTTTRVSFDASMAANAAAISAINTSLNALRTSGRLSHSQRTAPRCSISMC